MEKTYRLYGKDLTVNQIKNIVDSTPLKNIDYKLFRMIEGKSIIDLGCSFGKITVQIGRKFPEAMVKGKDIVPDIVELAQKLHGHQPNVSFEIGSTDNIGEPAGTVDCVILKATLEHLESPAAAIRNIHAVLKTNGIIIVAVPYAYYWQTMLANLKRAYRKKTNPKTYRFDDKSKYVCHLSIWDSIALNTVLTENGFEFIEMDYASGFFTRSRLGNFLDTVFPFFCNEIMIKARKT